VPRDGDLPELEIELIPATSRSNTPANSQSPAARTGSKHRRRAPWLLACVVAIIVAIVVTSLATDDADTDDEAAPTTTARIEPLITVVPTTTRTSSPNMLGANPTGLSLWSFDPSFRLQILDLDTGMTRRFEVTGDGDIVALGRETAVIWGFQDGTRVVDNAGATLRRFRGFPARPVAVLGTDTLWVLVDQPERRWQLHHPDGGLIAEMPYDPTAQLVHFRERMVLVVTRAGTSSYDTVTKQTQFLTTTPVIAAGGGTMIGLRCNGDRCVLSAIDVESRRERTFETHVPIDDVRDWALSPDGRYLAISRKASGQGRFAQIIDVATSLTVWNSPDGISFAGFGPAWSWSPDSTRFFVTMSSQRVIAVDVRSQPFTQTDIAIPLTPLHGIAVTAR
jgi:hypothetical protein